MRIVAYKHDQDGPYHDGEVEPNAPVVDVPNIEFDPSLHEAVQHEGDGSNPVIGTVMRRGYKFGDHVLRHALVGVVDTPAEPETANNADTVINEDAE